MTAAVAGRARPERPPAVEIDGLRHDYPAGSRMRTALDVPRFIVPAGAALGLAGPSGSGKSTLLNVCAGMLTPTAGAIRILGVDLRSLSQAELDRLRASRVGYVFQSFNLIPALTALENVLVALDFGKVTPKALRRAKAERLLGEVGLGDRLDARPKALSHGEMQRVGIARALANDPGLLLADEPTASLEPGLAQSIVDLLMSLTRQSGAALLVASHDPRVLARFDRVVDLARPDGRGECAA